MCDDDGDWRAPRGASPLWVYLGLLLVVASAGLMIWAAFAVAAMFATFTW